MMSVKKLVLFCLVFLFAGTLFAQWTPRSLQYRFVKKPDFFNPLHLHFSDTSNGFLLNSGALMQYQNGSWFPVEAGDPFEFTYNGLFTVNPRNTFLCSSDGRITKRDENGLMSILYTVPAESGASPVLNTIYMSDSLQGWAAGDSGTLIRIDGETITLSQLDLSHNLKNICFDAPDHGWMIGFTQSGLGNFGVVYEYTGGQWVLSTLLDEYLYDIEFSSPDHGFIAGENALYRYDPVDHVWEAENIPGYHRQLSISLLNDDYGISVSDNSSVLIYQENSWQQGLPAPGVADLVSVHVIGEGKAWAVSQFGTGNLNDYNEGKIQQMDNSSWSSFSLTYLNTVQQLPVNYAITNIRGIGKKDIWLNGQYLSIPGDTDWPAGTPLLQSDTFCQASRFFSKQFGLGTDGELKEWDGGFWFNKNLDPVNPDTSYSNLSMHVFDDTSAFICRQRLIWASGAVLNQVSRYNYNSNQLESTSPLSTRYPFDIQFSGTRHGWIVGDSGLTARYRDGSWQVLHPVTTQRLNAVAITDTAHAWAVGDGGILLHYNGAGWTRYPLPTEQNLYSIQFKGHLGWITGDSGLIFRYNGTNWLPDSSGTTEALYSIYMADSTWGFAGGGNGLLLQYKRSGPPPPQPRQFCENGNSYFTYRPATGDGYSFQWQVDTGTGYTNITPSALYAGINTDTLRLTAMPPFIYGYRFRCIATLNGIDSVSNEEQLRFVSRWTGALSDNWENPGNWSCGAVPGTETDVEIEAGEVRINTPVSIRSLRLGPGVDCRLRDGGSLTILH